LRYNPPAPKPNQSELATELIKAEGPACLISKDGQRITIDKDVFNIGRADSFSDMHIESIHVGRQHCVIERVNSQHFITDLNSKNKTYVDGNIVWPYSRVQIQDKSVIRIADEEFEFRKG
jgi:pSer/pThr/pTyr-binding forkhead associated (FHA) protein